MRSALVSAVAEFAQTSKATYDVFDKHSSTALGVFHHNAFSHLCRKGIGN